MEAGLGWGGGGASSCLTAVEFRSWVVTFKTFPGRTSDLSRKRKDKDTDQRRWSRNPLPESTNCRLTLDQFGRLPTSVTPYRPHRHPLHRSFHTSQCQPPSA
jgi:hypothetical protein